MSPAKSLMIMIVACLVNYPVNINAQDKIDCNHANTQQEMNACANQSYENADKTLNKTYQEILEKYRHDTVALTHIRKAQKAWIAFRDAELVALYPPRTQAGWYGSALPLCKAQMLTYLVQERIKQLQQHYLTSAEGNVCAFTSTAQ